jgi:hypothetical protein
LIRPPVVGARGRSAYANLSFATQTPPTRPTQPRATQDSVDEGPGDLPEDLEGSGYDELDFELEAHVETELFRSIKGIVGAGGQFLGVNTIKGLTLNSLKKVCKEYQYKMFDSRGNEVVKTLSGNTNNGGVGLVKRRAITFNLWRYMRTLGTLPSYLTRPSGGMLGYTPNEKVRLVSAYVDPDHKNLFQLTIEKASRLELDAVNGNPNHEAHRMICRKFNDFDNYLPKNPFAGEDGELGDLDPNDRDIRVRGPDSTRGQFAHMKSEFKMAHFNWKRSGHNDPEAFNSYIWVPNQLHVLFLWRLF